MAPKTSSNFGVTGIIERESDLIHGNDKYSRSDAKHSTKNVQSKSTTFAKLAQHKPSLLPWCGLVVWPLMLFVPILLAYSPFSYHVVFEEEWYTYDNRPKPLGLCLGISAVAVGQAFVLVYFYLHSSGYLNKPQPIQKKGAPQYVFFEGVRVHLSQPEGFVLLVAYLALTWMYNLMPRSYYSFEGGIQWGRLAMCLATQDFVQYIMHLLEHNVSATFYKYSHKPHHKFTNPRLFDAFNGSLADTVIMILIPLYTTALLVHVNVWTYMAFGSMYANWLTLIHSEYPLPWDKTFRKLGLGTPGDHHIHHKLFKYNFGHLFMWWDRFFGTYKSPMDYPAVFSDSV